VACNYARIFLQNSINLGLRTVVCPDIEASEGDELEFAGGKVVNTTTSKGFATLALPKARQAIIDAGGLIAYTRKRVIKKI
jgi:3-isopropylmalate/(R)-2-methylmalate dehydratase small subunit